MADQKVHIGEGSRFSEDSQYFRNGFRILRGSLSVFCNYIGNAAFRIGSMGEGDTLKRCEFDDVFSLFVVAETDLDILLYSEEVQDSVFETSLIRALYREYPESPRIITLKNLPEMVYALVGERESFDRNLRRQNRNLIAYDINALLGEQSGMGEPEENAVSRRGSVPSKNALLGIVREIAEWRGLEIHDGWSVFDIPVLSLEEKLKAFAEINGFRIRRLRLSGNVIRADNRYLVFRQTDDSRKRIPMILSLAGGHNCLSSSLKGGTREFFKKNAVLPVENEAYEFLFREFETDNSLKMVFRKRSGYRIIFLLFLISSLLIYGITPFFADYFVSGILPFGEEDEIFRCFMFLALLILVWGGFEMVPRMLLDAVSVRNTEWQCFRIMDNFFLSHPDRIRRFSRGDLMRGILRPLSGASRNYDSFFAFFLHSSVILAALIPLFAIGGPAAGMASLLLAGFFGAVACLVTFLAIVKAREAQKYRETYRRIIRETAQGIVHVRACNAENNAARKFLKSFVPGMEAESSMRIRTALYHYCVAIFPVLSLPALLIIMSFFEKTALSENLAVLIAGFFLVTAVVNLAVHAVRWRSRKQESRNELLEDDGNSQAGKIVRILDGHVEVKNISFRYQGQEEYVFKNVSMDIAPGQFVAIVGPSGSGKTTLIRLLLGELGLESGQIFWSGLGQGALNLHFLRRQVGTAMLDSTVFAGTILDNIVIGTAAGEEEAWKALELASFAAEVRSWPMGIHTAISRDRISGGQMQKLLIARALVTNPRVLILDEATSALDTISQDRILSNISRMHITRIVTTHRMSTVINADRIYILDRGGIQDAGTYRELMGRSKFFRMLALGKNREDHS